MERMREGRENKRGPVRGEKSKRKEYMEERDKQKFLNDTGGGGPDGPLGSRP